MAIEIENVSFEYIAGNAVFRGATCSVKRGEILSVLGPNGCGKTTLLKCIAGILSPSTGFIRFSGDSTIGYVPQEHLAAFPYTVLEAVLMGRARAIGLFSVPQQSDYEAALRALSTLAIAHLAEKPCTAISGGEKQLVLIARALASNTPLLVLDEPASSLDFKNQQLILEILQTLSRKQRYAVIMTTHHPQHALSISDKVLLMSPNAHPPLFGNTAEVLTEPNLKRIYGIDAKIITLPHGSGTVTGVIPLPRFEN